VVDEEFVKVREGPDPADAEKSGRRARPDPRDEPLELSAIRQPHPASLGESLEKAWKDEAGASDEIAFTQHDVGGEVFGSPTVEQCGYVGAELFEEIA
jgi:hypothetical protein